MKKTLDFPEKGRVATSLFDEIEDMYEIPTEHIEAVERFLEAHKYLFPILKEAEEQIVSVFGMEAETYLELHRDPEEDWEELFIIIKSEYSAEEAFRLENRLAEEWFLNRIKDTKGKLNIIEEPL